MYTRLLITLKNIHYIFEFLLLAISFILFSSKISILPWYIPLTTYVLLYILILIILQFMLFLYTWYIYEKKARLKFLFKTCFSHLLLLLLMFCLCIFSINWFNIFTVITCIGIIILIIYTYTNYSTNT